MNQIAFYDKKQIGFYNLREAKTFTNTYEFAAWYEDVLVQPGRYPVIMYDMRVYDDGQIFAHGAYVNFPGTIVSDYFAAHYCGVPVSDYDRSKNAGKPSEHHGFWYEYMIADEILNGSDEWELFPEYEAREYEFVYDGVTKTSHALFLRDIKHDTDNAQGSFVRSDEQ